MKIYCAGPLFSQAERDFLASCARRLRGEGFDCFVPHEEELRVDPTPEAVFALDFEALSRADALVAWLDGPQGTTALRARSASSAASCASPAGGARASSASPPTGASTAAGPSGTTGE